MSRDMDPEVVLDRETLDCDQAQKGSHPKEPGVGGASLGVFCSLIGVGRGFESAEAMEAFGN